MIKICVFISGNGSNLQALLEACEEGHIKGEIGLVISDNSNAYGLTRAKKFGVPTKFIEEQPMRCLFEDKIEETLSSIFGENGVDLICLAGFMRVLSPMFVRRYKGKIINIHPSLLPSFPGLNAQKKAVEYGVRFSGCTTHFVDEGIDTGPIIDQAIVDLGNGCTEEELKEMILRKEHVLYRNTVRSFSLGNLILEGRKVRIRW